VIVPCQAVAGFSAITSWQDNQTREVMKWTQVSRCMVWQVFRTRYTMRGGG
jgi:hypothetical protein